MESLIQVEDTERRLTSPVTVCRPNRDRSGLFQTASRRQYGAMGWLASMALNGQQYFAFARAPLLQLLS